MVGGPHDRDRTEAPMDAGGLAMLVDRVLPAGGIGRLFVSGNPSRSGGCRGAGEADLGGRLRRPMKRRVR